MHVNEKTRACRCGTNYPSAAAVFVSEHPGETVFRPLSPYTAGGGAVAAAREPVLLALKLQGACTACRRCSR